ncbi:MAG: thiamine phosphate synthase [Rhodospirillales bacterium]|nr:thiamine phosphate synthase [Rhodospirillales bacterium]
MATLAETARMLNLRARIQNRAQTPACALPPLILVTDADRLADPETAVRRLPRGSAVILRHYRDPRRRELAHRLAAVCRRHALRLLIAGDARLARAVGADGVHLPEALVRHGCRSWRLWRRPGWIVTAAAHSPAALRAAAQAGADAVLLSPVFATRSHPDRPPLGVLKFQAWARRCSLPVYALGGITRRTAPRLTQTRAVGLAGIGGLIS